MATTYNIEIREFNGIDYDILYPKTTIENVDGLANSFSQIDDEIEGLSQDIDNLQRTKQDTATLKALAFKDKATLTNGENVFGILPVNYGGTGLISSPSMLVNLGSNASVNVMQASPQPGVTGKLGIANGGTNGTTASEARSNLGITDIATHPDYTISNTDLTAGSSSLATGKLYFYYE